MLAEADLPDLYLELLLRVAEVLQLEIDDWKPGGLVGVHLEDRGSPAAVLLLTGILEHLIPGLASVPDLQVVPGHKGKGFPCIASDVQVGKSVEAVEGDCLLRLG